MNNDMFIAGVKEKYPSELLEGRVNIEANVIGCMVSDMLLAEDTNLDASKFLTKDARLIFNVIKALRAKKCAVFDEVSVLTYVKDDVKEKLDLIGGVSAVKNIADCVNVKNYDSYLDDLLKANIILDMHKFGFNLLNPIEYEGKIIKPLKLFSKMSSDQVTDWYTAKLESFGTGYSSKVLEEEELDITDDFIQSLEDGEEAGCPFEYFDDDCNGKPVPALPYFSKVVNGIPDGFTIVGGYSNVGKTTLILTILFSMMHMGRKCMVISNEQRSKVFKIGFLLLILTKHFNYYNLTKTKLINGNISVTDREYIAKAQEYWRKHYKGQMYFISIPDSDVGLAIKKMRIGILNKGIQTLVYDTFKCDWTNNSNDSSWVSLIKDSRRFEALARKYPGTQVICTLQLAINTLGKLFLDSSVLSMSKQIKEVCDLMILCRTIYQEELDQGSKFYCDPFKTVQKDGKWVDEPWLPKPNKMYRAVFIEKNRSGSVSSDTGVGYIFGFQGEWGIWSDSAKAKFRHGYIQ
jgi:hypothetical protein